MIFMADDLLINSNPQSPRRPLWIKKAIGLGLFCCAFLGFRRLWMFFGNDDDGFGGDVAGALTQG
jgi:hypothetical protein